MKLVCCDTLYVLKVQCLKRLNKNGHKISSFFKKHFARFSEMLRLNGQIKVFEKLRGDYARSDNGGVMRREDSGILGNWFSQSGGVVCHELKHHKWIREL